MYAHRLDDKKHITIESWSAPGLSKPLFAEAIKQKYKPAHKGEMFGPSWVSHFAVVTHPHTPTGAWMLRCRSPVVQRRRPEHVADQLGPAGGNDGEP